MNYDRSWSITYLQQEYATIASKAYVNATDTVDGYKSILDNALTLLKFTDDELPTAIVPADKLSDYKEILKYYALEKFYNNFSVQTDTTFTNPGINSKKSIFFKNVDNLLKKAASKVTSLGYDIVASSDEWSQTIYYYAY